MTTEFDSDESGDFTLGVPVKIYIVEWNGYDLVLETAFEDKDKRYRCAHLEMRRRSDGSEVSAEDLPDVPVAAFIRDGIYTAAGFYFDSAKARWAGEPGGPSDDTLSTVARVYKLAEAIGDAPRKAVQDVYGVSTSTAGRWLSAARKKRLLDKTTVGAGGGRRPKRVTAS